MRIRKNRVKKWPVKASFVRGGFGPKWREITKWPEQFLAGLVDTKWEGWESLKVAYVAALNDIKSGTQGGAYQAMYGPILNPVEGDYSTGSIDPANARPINCNPEPRHCRWQYWESGLTKGDWLVPRFHCLQVSGEWWVVEVAGAHGMAQQVAALDFADNPEHNFGIHEKKEGTIYLNRTDPESEYSKVLRENLLPWRG